MEEPKKPNEADCCGSGCKCCIFDIYKKKLENWKNGKFERNSNSCLSETEFSPFSTIAVENLTNSLKIFKFQSVSPKNKNNDNLDENEEKEIYYEVQKAYIKIRSGEYLTLRGTHQNTTIFRSYTPVLLEKEFEKGIFTIIVSLLKNGQMSQFLDQLTVGDIVYWRGPYREFQYRKNSFKLLLMIGGGTGVVPLYNILKSLVEDEEEETLLHLLCSFKSVKYFILRRELNQLLDYWNVRVQTFISNTEKPDDFEASYKESITVGKINEFVISKELNEFQINDIFALVSGPENFNKSMRKHLLNLGFNSDNIFIFW